MSSVDPTKIPGDVYAAIAAELRKGERPAESSSAQEEGGVVPASEGARREMQEDERRTIASSGGSDVRLTAKNMVLDVDGEYIIVRGVTASDAQRIAEIAHEQGITALLDFEDVWEEAPPLSAEEIQTALGHEARVERFHSITPEGEIHFEGRKK